MTKINGIWKMWSYMTKVYDIKTVLSLKECQKAMVNDACKKKKITIKDLKERENEAE